MNPGLLTVVLLSFLPGTIPHMSRPMEEEKEGECAGVQPEKMVTNVDFHNIQPYPELPKANGTVTTDSSRKTFGSALSDFENAALTF